MQCGRDSVCLRDQTIFESPVGSTSQLSESEALAVLVESMKVTQDSTASSLDASNNFHRQQRHYLHSLSKMSVALRVHAVS